MTDLDPKALAECGHTELDERDGVQEVSAGMIREYVIAENELPPESARPFAAYLHEVWNDYNEDGTATNGEVIAGALAFWRGQ